MERRIARMSSAPGIGRRIKQHSVGSPLRWLSGGGTQQLLLRKVQNCRPPPSTTPRDRRKFLPSVRDHVQQGR